jgi:hypothetical protein
VKPLRNETGATDPNIIAAQALLAKVGPLEPSADRKRRVRLRLDSSSRVTTMPPLLRPALIAAVLLGVTAAGAKLGGVLPDSPVEAMSRLFDNPVQALQAPVEEAKARSLAVRAPARPAPEEAEAQAEEPVADAAEPRRNRPVQAAPGASSPGSKLMVEAMKARRSGDTARASRLLDEYQKKYPEGALKEEALALSMEAAAARGDASAAKLARQYLGRYPNGRFREQAQRVLRNPQR